MMCCLFFHTPKLKLRSFVTFIKNKLISSIFTSLVDLKGEQGKSPGVRRSGNTPLDRLINFLLEEFISKEIFKILFVEFLHWLDPEIESMHHLISRPILAFV
jgi:hypothetical protein